MRRARIADIDRFLGLKRIAVVGVSRAEKDFSRVLFRELASRGYDAVPVNPAVAASGAAVTANADTAGSGEGMGVAGSIEGRTCYASVSAIPEPVEGVLIMTPAAHSRAVVDDAAVAGVGLVWLHRGAGQGAVSDEAIAAADGHGMVLIAGQCPFMFLPQSGAVHKVHRFFKRLGRSYPTAAA